MRLWILAWLVMLAGCFGSSTTECPGGVVCPPSLVCATTEPVCVLPDQLAACKDMADGTACTFAGTSGHCQDSICIGAACGNGHIDPGEVCDDGNTTSGDGCRGDCRKAETCGDGVIDLGETCDDHNTTGGDGCSATCKVEVCGNHIIDVGEDCDDGNAVGGDGCGPTCKTEVCGNGFLDIGEDCDDGNTTAGDGCGATCKTERCGNHVVDPGETCDDGNQTSGDGCSADCLSDETCGNGHLDLAKNEQCDAGAQNSAAPNAPCRPDCTLPHCGDGAIDTSLGETCDAGAANANAPDAACRTNCQPQRCGDHVVDPAAGEACDDGNATSGDGCSADCKSNEMCGNGYIDIAAGEQCDAGAANSNSPNAACRPTCRLPSCGDSIVDSALGEDCDGTTFAQCGSFGLYGPGPVTCSGCRFNTSACQRCGDGVKNGPEQCDGTDLAGSTCTDFGFYNTAGLTCRPLLCSFDTSRCTGYCGDGLVTSSKESCDGAPAGICTQFGFDDGVLGCGASCASDFGGCRSYGWQPIGPTQYTENGIWGSGPNDIYVVGFGTIYHWNGTALTTITPPGNQVMQAIWGSSASDVFAVGASGAIWHFNGTTWTSMQAPADLSALQLNGVAGISANDVYAVGSSSTGGAVIHYDGTSWSTVTTGLTLPTLFGVWEVAPAQVYAVGNAGTIVQLQGGAWTSQTQTTNRLNNVWASSPTDIYIVGGAGTILHSIDGITWTAQSSNPATSQDLYGISGTSATNVFVTGNAGVILHSTGGDGWLAQNSAALVALNAVWADRSGVAWATGASFVERYQGDSWTAGTAFTGNKALNAVWSPTSAVSYAVGESGTILRWNGGTLSALVTPAGFNSVKPAMNAVWGTNATNVFAAGMTGWIMQCDGTNCVKQVSGGNNLYALWGASATNVYAVGAAGTIMHTTNGGGAWTASTQGSTDLTAIWGSGPNDIYALALAASPTTPPTIYHFNGGWSAVPTPRGVDPTMKLYGVWGTSPSNVFVVGSHGRIFHFDGTRWQMMPTPTPLDLFAIAGTGPVDIYAVGAGGVALHYDGRAWMQLQPHAGGNDLHGVAAASGDVVAVGQVGELVELVRAATSCGTRESSCGNYFDDDCDGIADACDSDCARPTEQCGNGLDDDCDGAVDCADSDCATELRCTNGGLCKAATAISCGQVLSGTTVGLTDRIEQYACSPAVDSGPETSFKLVTGSLQTVTVTVMPTGGGGDLDLAVLGAAATTACDPIGQCITAASTATAPETATFVAASGTAYYLVVDGFDRASSDFTISVSCQ